MPWKECHVEDERLRFVARLLDGEKLWCADYKGEFMLAEAAQKMNAASGRGI